MKLKANKTIQILSLHTSDQKHFTKESCSLKVSYFSKIIKYSIQDEVHLLRVTQPALLWFTMQFSFQPKLQQVISLDTDSSVLWFNGSGPIITFLSRWCIYSTLCSLIWSCDVFGPKVMLECESLTHNWNTNHVYPSMFTNTTPGGTVI